MTQADRAAIATAAQASPSMAWKEVVEADEQTLFEGFAREITARQKEVATETGGPLRRGFHAKLHAGLISWEIPRLCRGGSRSLTYPAVRAPAIRCH